MKRLSTAAVSLFAALAFIAVSANAPAYAGKKERRIAAGILLGAIGGAIIANEIHRKKKKRHHHRDYGHRHHSTHVYDDDIYVEPRSHRSHRSHRRYNRNHRVRHNSRLSRWERHVRRCYARYRTYDERSDTFIGYDGYEHRCRL